MWYVPRFSINIGQELMQGTPASFLCVLLFSCNAVSCFKLMTRLHLPFSYVSNFPIIDIFYLYTHTQVSSLLLELELELRFSF